MKFSVKKTTHTYTQNTYMRKLEVSGSCSRTPIKPSSSDPDFSLINSVYNLCLTLQAPIYGPLSTTCDNNGTRFRASIIVDDLTDPFHMYSQFFCTWDQTTAGRNTCDPRSATTLRRPIFSMHSCTYVDSEFITYHELIIH